MDVAENCHIHFILTNSSFVDNRVLKTKKIQHTVNPDCRNTLPRRLLPTSLVLLAACAATAASVKLPISPKVESLNVSTAAAIALYEINRR